jgi:hypothetical protein
MRSGATWIGLALVVLGILAFVYRGIGYTTRKKVVDIGPIQATKQEHKTIPLRRYLERSPWWEGSF